MNRNDLTFELTPELVKLLRNSYVSRYLSDVETGAAEIDGKRPYGNSYVALDIAEMFGWDDEIDPDYDMPDELYQRCMKLHEQTPQALQVVLASGSFEPGTYRRSTSYTRDWKKDDNAS